MGCEVEQVLIVVNRENELWDSRRVKANIVPKRIGQNYRSQDCQVLLVAIFDLLGVHLGRGKFTKKHS